MNLPSGGNLNAEECRKGELRLRVVTTISTTHPHNGNIQLTSAVLEISKCPEEHQIDWGAFYLSFGQNDSSTLGDKCLTKQVVKALDGIKSAMEFNLQDTSSRFEYTKREGYTPKRLGGRQ